MNQVFIERLTPPAIKKRKAGHIHDRKEGDHPNHMSSPFVLPI